MTIRATSGVGKPSETIMADVVEEFVAALNLGTTLNTTADVGKMASNDVGFTGIKSDLGSIYERHLPKNLNMDLVNAVHEYDENFRVTVAGSLGLIAVNSPDKDRLMVAECTTVKGGPAMSVTVGWGGGGLGRDGLFTHVSDSLLSARCSLYAERIRNAMKQTMDEKTDGKDPVDLVQLMSKES